MPVRLESDLEKRVVKAAERKGWWALKLTCIGHRGFPDRWFIRPGTDHPEIILIEFKAPGKRARKLQAWVCNRLREVGLEVYQDIDDWATAKEILGL